MAKTFALLTLMFATLLLFATFETPLMVEAKWSVEALPSARINAFDLNTQNMDHATSTSRPIDASATTRVR
ncbi:hypothetical protein ACHQM5_016326 [Ranunculus cassubicifolius]